MASQVGYMVHLPKSILQTIREKEDIELFIYSHIREDCFDLYGFPTAGLLELFKLLITIKGIGPKAALEIISTDEQKIRSAIMNSDHVFIAQVPGIGKKTAERVILELKNKITTGETELYTPLEEKIQEEAIEALLQLGFKRNQIHQKISQLPKNLSKTEDIIHYFLRNA